ncbi:MAG: hypothetical protein FIA92_11375 [Chloroflexi bacterium]|nr:hypothetical protein [Chloroflexota bacterium]
MTDTDPKPQKVAIVPIAWAAVTGPADAIEIVMAQARQDGAGDYAYLLPLLRLGVIRLSSVWSVQELLTGGKTE